MNKTSSFASIARTVGATGGEFRFGDVLVRDKLITRQQLDDALTAQRASEKHIPLQQVLVDQKVLTVKQVEEALASWNDRPPLGELLLRHGVITRSQLAQALEQQKKVPAPLGQTLINLGYLSDVNFRKALSVQLGIPYVDLDNITLEAGLCRIINRNYARRHSLVP